jgi:hypothetical protein
MQKIDFTTGWQPHQARPWQRQDHPDLRLRHDVPTDVNNLFSLALFLQQNKLERLFMASLIKLG